MLPDDFLPTIRQAEPVLAGQILATKSVPKEYSVNIAKQLNVSPHSISKYLKKNPGDVVMPGDVLAVKKKILGSKSRVVCKIAGSLSRIDRSTGEIFLTPIDKESVEVETIISPIEGIIALCNNEKILIETTKDFIEGVKGIGEHIERELFFLHDYETVNSFHLQAEVIGKIVVGNYFPKEVLAKAASIGVSGVIGTKILDGDMTYLWERNLLLPIVEILPEDMVKLKKWNNKKTYMSGKAKTVILLHV